jgi:hypothetical protein
VRQCFSGDSRVKRPRPDVQRFHRERAMMSEKILVRNWSTYDLLILRSGRCNSSVTAVKLPEHVLPDPSACKLWF